MGGQRDHRALDRSYVRGLYEEMARRWPEAPLFPLNETPQHDGSWHLEFPGDGSAEVASTERGIEFERRRFTDLNELLYWIFRVVTMDAGFRYEVSHRCASRDARRIAFAHAIAAMDMVSLEWSKRLQGEIAEILADDPYCDAAGDGHEIHE